MSKPDYSETSIFNPARRSLQIPAPDGTIFVVDHQRNTLSIGVAATNAVRYSLSADGQPFVAKERLCSASLNYDNTWVRERST